MIEIKIPVGESVKLQFGSNELSALTIRGDADYFQSLFQSSMEVAQLKAEVFRLKGKNISDWEKRQKEPFQTITDLQTAIRVLGGLPVSAVHWLPMSIAPKDETKILVFHHRDGAVVAQWGRMCERWCIVGGDSFVDPSWWMPLPKSPKESSCS